MHQQQKSISNYVYVEIYERIAFNCEYPSTMKRKREREQKIFSWNEKQESYTVDLKKKIVFCLPRSCIFNYVILIVNE